MLTELLVLTKYIYSAGRGVGFKGAFAGCSKRFHMSEVNTIKLSQTAFGAVPAISICF
jgi:hypothetical protein